MTARMIPVQFDTQRPNPSRAEPCRAGLVVPKSPIARSFPSATPRAPSERPATKQLRSAPCSLVTAERLFACCCCCPQSRRRRRRRSNNLVSGLAALLLPPPPPGGVHGSCSSSVTLRSADREEHRLQIPKGLAAAALPFYLPSQALSVLAALQKQLG